MYVLHVLVWDQLAILHFLWWPVQAPTHILWSPLLYTTFLVFPKHPELSFLDFKTLKCWHWSQANFEVKRDAKQKQKAFLNACTYSPSSTHFRVVGLFAKCHFPHLCKEINVKEENLTKYKDILKDNAAAKKKYFFIIRNNRNVYLLPLLCLHLFQPEQSCLQLLQSKVLK